MRARSILAVTTALALAAGVSAISASAGDSASPKAEAPSGDARAGDPAHVLGFTMNRINGKTEPLSAYQGKVVLIVNVASKCGFTPQYEGLEALYKAHKDEGLVVLGFPANNFREQEPGTNEEIAEFCSSKYSVTFPMFAKISVKGDDQHPLYRKLTGQPAPIGGEVKWNFQKYLVDRAGNVVAMYGSRTKPDDPDLVGKIEELLAAK